MFRINGEESQLLLCPYDKSHNIRLSRMQVHLVKCRRNHGSAEKAQCPFNFTHVVNAVELDVHVKICPNRKGFEAFRLKDEIVNESLRTRDLSVAGSVESFDIPKMEPLEERGWDTEVNNPPYNPEAYVATAHILRQPRGLTPSERRKFRAMERDRLLKNKLNE